MEKVNASIRCELAETRRGNEYIKVYGASNVKEAREAAIKFAECPDGITLCKGYHNTWCYDDEPQPIDWKDTYWFNYEDEFPLNGCFF